jgi:predicted dehydrogenase
MREGVRVGLIGTGFMGEFHARAYQRVQQLTGSPVDLVAVADVAAEPARAFANRWGIPFSTENWRELVADPAIQAVDICTPPILHREIGLAAISAGKHVYCEKPVGLTVTDTQALADAARHAGCRTLVGYNYRWFPAVQHAVSLIRAGALGSLRHVRVTFESDWASDPSVPWAWRLERASAGHGALGDVGSHVFDMARLLGGELAAVSGLTRTFVDVRTSEFGTHTVDTDDAFDAIATFVGGATGEFHGSRVATGSKVEFRWEVVGEQGALRWDVGRLNELRRYKTQAGETDDGFKTIFLGPQHANHGNFSPVQGLGLGFEDSKVIELSMFLRSVANGVDLGPNFEDALSVARILDAVAIGGWVELLGGERP